MYYAICTNSTIDPTDQDCVIEAASLRTIYSFIQHSFRANKRYITPDRIGGVSRWVVYKGETEDDSHKLFAFRQKVSGDREWKTTVFRHGGAAASGARVLYSL